MKKRNKEQKQHGRYNETYTTEAELRNDAILSKLFNERNDRGTKRNEFIPAESKEPLQPITETNGSIYEFDFQELRRSRNTRILFND